MDMIEGAKILSDRIGAAWDERERVVPTQHSHEQRLRRKCSNCDRVRLTTRVTLGQCEFSLCNDCLCDPNCENLCKDGCAGACGA